MPFELCGFRFLCADAAERGRAEARGRLLNKSSARQSRILGVTLAHALTLLCKTNSQNCRGSSSTATLGCVPLLSSAKTA